MWEQNLKPLTAAELAELKAIEMDCRNGLAGGGLAGVQRRDLLRNKMLYFAPQLLAAAERDLDAHARLDELISRLKQAIGEADQNVRAENERLLKAGADFRDWMLQQPPASVPEIPDAVWIPFSQTFKATQLMQIAEPHSAETKTD